ncbi:MAG: BrnT family toxin [Candidatus Zhuqueibacterota bacterium]
MNEQISGCIGFDRDDGNSEKNWIRHQVPRNESEQVFFNEPLIIADDTKHSQYEIRWYTLGRTDAGRLLFIVFTVRDNLIRIMSARDMNINEREIYNEKIKKDTSI